ncbi:MAG TPA: twin-arginine translocase TatA/TatE family subunit [Pirellulales bacterium]|nr:twin-arginine translocase TatA/TatE family subunit [Pirellulales bacterium]
MFGLSPVELLVIGGLAVLLFGSRLPSVARSLGKSMTEFKRGLHDIQDDVRSVDRVPSKSSRFHEIDDRDEATAPKFEPPAAEPTVSEPVAAEKSDNMHEANAFHAQHDGVQTGS